jgi:hypothetical protein
VTVCEKSEKNRFKICSEKIVKKTKQNMASGPVTTLGDLEDQAMEIFTLYTNLTSLVLGYGYEYILENMEKSEGIACIPEILDFFDMLELIMAGEDLPEGRRRPDEPERRRHTGGDNDYLLRIGTARKKIFGDKTPVHRRQMTEPEPLFNEYLKVGNKLKERLSKSNLEPRGHEDFFNNKLERSAFIDHSHKSPQKHRTFDGNQPSTSNNQHITELKLRQIVKEKIQDELSKSIPGVQLQSPNIHNHSINVEDLDLKI